MAPASPAGASWLARLRAAMRAHPDVRTAPVGVVYGLAADWRRVAGRGGCALVTGMGEQEIEYATRAVDRWTAAVERPRRVR